MDLSTGILNDFVRLASKYTFNEIFNLNIKSQFIISSNRNEILNFINYIGIVSNNKFNIDLQTNNPSFKKNILRLYFLKKYSNDYRNKILYGINDFYENRITVNEKFCTQELDLDDLSKIDNYKWWLSLLSNDTHIDQLLNGYKGELLSLDYEAIRLNLHTSRLIHKSLISAKFGYDIQSFLDEKNLTIKIAIEVKTIQNTSNKIYLTRNEINTSKYKTNYFFHIWKFKKAGADLYVMKNDELAIHFPNEKGSGQVETISIDLTDILEQIKPSFNIKKVN